MKMNEVTAGQVAGAADTVRSAAGLGQLGAMGAAKVAGKLAPAANIGGKFAKFIPGLGLVASGADAVRRASAGDWGGAALSAGAGLAGLVPGIGTAASLGLTAAQMGLDKYKTGSFMPDTDELAAASGKGAKDGFGPGAEQPAAQQPAAQQPAQQLPPGADPKTYALQQQLIAKGAKISLDGKMGPQTQAAMKQFGMAESLKERKMSQQEQMKNLMERLDCINEDPALMEYIRLDESVSNIFESLAAQLGYKGAKNQLLEDVLDLMDILEGIDTLPKKEQDIIVGLFEYDSSGVNPLVAQRMQAQDVAANMKAAMQSGRAYQDSVTAGVQGQQAAQTAQAKLKADLLAKQAARKAAGTAGQPADGIRRLSNAEKGIEAAKAAQTAPAAGAGAAANPGMWDKIKTMGGKGLDMAKKAGSWIAKNPGKAALAGLAAGAVGYGAKQAYDYFNKPGETPAAPTPGTATKPAAQKPGGTAAKPAAPAAGGGKLNPQEEQELALLANELGAYMGKSPQVDALLLRHQKLRGEIPQP
jgi:peptidoglycan hydrolase-like protein with peptidoglycan-binding domain